MNEPVAHFYPEGEGCTVYDIKFAWKVTGTTEPIPLYTHPAKTQYKFGVDWSKDGNAVTVLKICEDGVAEVVFMNYQEVTHPAKELHLSLQKVKDTGELLAVTYTDDEHRIVEVLWQKPPALTDEEIRRVADEVFKDYKNWHYYQIDFARAILRKVQEK